MMKTWVLLYLAVGAAAQESSCEDVSGLLEQLEVAKKQAARDADEIGGLERALKTGQEELAAAKAESAAATEKFEAEVKAAAARETRKVSELEEALKATEATLEALRTEVAETTRSAALAAAALAEEKAVPAPSFVGLSFEGGVLSVAVNTSSAASTARSLGSAATSTAKEYALTATSTAKEYASSAGEFVRDLRVTAKADAYRRRYVSPVVAKASATSGEALATLSAKAATTFAAAEVSATKFLKDKNFTKVVAGYENAKGVVGDKGPQVMANATRLVAQAYAATKPKATALAAKTSETASAVASKATATATTYLAPLSNATRLLDAAAAACLRCRDLLVLKAGVEPRWANALVAVVAAALAALLVVAALAIVKVLVVATLRSLLSLLTLTTFLARAVLLKTPVYLTTDLLPAVALFALRLLVVYPLKLLVSPVTVPVHLIGKALSPRPTKTTPGAKSNNNNNKKQPAVAAASSGNTTQHHKKHHHKKK